MLTSNSIPLALTILLTAHRWNLPTVIWVSMKPLGHPSVLSTTRVGPIPGMLTVETTSGIRHTCTAASLVHTSLVVH